MTLTKEAGKLYEAIWLLCMATLQSPYICHKKIDTLNNLIHINYAIFTIYQ